MDNWQDFQEATKMWVFNTFWQQPGDFCFWLFDQIAKFFEPFSQAFDFVVTGIGNLTHIFIYMYAAMWFLMLSGNLIINIMKYTLSATERKQYKAMRVLLQPFLSLVFNPQGGLIVMLRFTGLVLYILLTLILMMVKRITQFSPYGERDFWTRAVDNIDSTKQKLQHSKTLNEVEKQVRAEVNAYKEKDKRQKKQISELAQQLALYKETWAVMKKQNLTPAQYEKMNKF